MCLRGFLFLSKARLAVARHPRRCIAVLATAPDRGEDTLVSQRTGEDRALHVPVAHHAGGTHHHAPHQAAARARRSDPPGRGDGTGRGRMVHLRHRRVPARGYNRCGRLTRGPAAPDRTSFHSENARDESHPARGGAGPRPAGPDHNRRGPATRADSGATQTSEGCVREDRCHIRGGCGPEHQSHPAPVRNAGDHHRCGPEEPAEPVLRL